VGAVAAVRSMRAKPPAVVESGGALERLERAARSAAAGGAALDAAIDAVARALERMGPERPAPEQVRLALAFGTVASACSEHEAAVRLIRSVRAWATAQRGRAWWLPAHLQARAVAADGRLDRWLALAQEAHASAGQADVPGEMRVVLRLDVCEAAIAYEAVREVPDEARDLALALPKNAGPVAPERALRAAADVLYGGVRALDAAVDETLAGKRASSVDTLVSGRDELELLAEALEKSGKQAALGAQAGRLAPLALEVLRAAGEMPAPLEVEHALVQAVGLLPRLCRMVGAKAQVARIEERSAQWAAARPGWAAIALEAHRAHHRRDPRQRAARAREALGLLERDPRFAGGSPAAELAWLDLAVQVAKAARDSGEASAASEMVKRIAARTPPPAPVGPRRALHEMVTAAARSVTGFR
jgi:hypothetical protein